MQPDNFDVEPDLQGTLPHQSKPLIVQMDGLSYPDLSPVPLKGEQAF
jgi:hypothetical protein